MTFINEAEVAKVMKDTGMDRMQAIRHVQQRTWIQEQQRRGAIKTYPLGKTAELA